MTSDLTRGEAELATVSKREEGEEVVKQLRRQLEQVGAGSQSHPGVAAWTAEPELGY